MKVTFSHPHSSNTFQADVDPQCSGSTALQGLIDAKFLDPPGQGGYDLTLARTSSPIGPNTTLGSCGVQEGDLISVLRRGSGA
jgi:hypothetical protein